jgi:hypothetical protein
MAVAAHAEQGQSEAGRGLPFLKADDGGACGLQHGADLGEVRGGVILGTMRSSLGQTLMRSKARSCSTSALSTGNGVRPPGTVMAMGWSVAASAAER